MHPLLVVVPLGTIVIGVCAGAIWVFRPKPRSKYLSRRRLPHETRDPVPFATLNALWEQSRATPDAAKEEAERAQPK
jgi:uncharacterized membrane protein